MKNMRTVKALFMLALFLRGFSILAHAATGFAFLEMNANTRASGLGGASTAMANESRALLGNPSGTASLSHMDFALMHSTWIEQMSFESVVLAIPSSIGTFGVGAVWLATPGLERRAVDRELLGTFGATSWSGLVSYSTNLEKTVSFGVNLKLVGEQLDDISATGVAIDLGGQWRTPVEGLTAGFAIQHLGAPVKYLTDSTSLPTTFSFGAAYQLPIGMLIAADWTYQAVDQRSALHVGTELTPYGPLALRVGYSSLQSATGTSTVTVGPIPIPTGFVGGIGVMMGGHTLDYAVVPVSGFGLTHRLGLRTSW